MLLSLLMMQEALLMQITKRKKASKHNKIVETMIEPL